MVTFNIQCISRNFYYHMGIPYLLLIHEQIFPFIIKISHLKYILRHLQSETLPNCTPENSRRYTNIGDTQLQNVFNYIFYITGYYICNNIMCSKQFEGTIIEVYDCYCMKVNDKHKPGIISVYMESGETDSQFSKSFKCCHVDMKLNWFMNKKPYYWVLCEPVLRMYLPHHNTNFTWHTYYILQLQVAIPYCNLYS